jgi:hypothetical protein
MLQIRKKLENVFKHFTDQGDFLLSKGYFKLDNGVFQIVEEGGARRFNYSLSEISIFDDTVSGTAEFYTTDIGLYNRLVELRYNLLDLNGLAPINPVTNINETPLDLPYEDSNVFTLPENYIIVDVFINIALQKKARYVRTSTGITILETLEVGDIVNVRGFVTSGNFTEGSIIAIYQGNNINIDFTDPLRPIISAVNVNIGNTPNPTGIALTSTTGTGSTLPATTGVNAGLLLPAEKSSLATLNNLAYGQAYLDNYRSRILNDLGTSHPSDSAYVLADLKKNDLLNKASLIITPSATKASKLFAIKPQNGNGDLTVVRNTTATRVNEDGFIESVSANVPRIDYSDGEASILIESQRTNLVLKSDPIAYSSSGGANIVFQPFNWDIGLIFNSLYFPSNALDRYYYFSVANSTTFTISFFAKMDNNGIPKLGNAINDATLDLVIDNITSFSNFSATLIKDNVYKLSATVISGSNFSVIAIRKRTTHSNNAIRVSGIQIEQGSNASSYIPTVASAVTRNAEVISKTGISDLIGQSEGTLFLEVNNFKGSFVGNKLTGISDGGGVNNFFGLYNINERIYIRNRQNSVDLNLIILSNTISRHKAAISFNSSGVKVFINGVLVNTSTTAYNGFANTVELLGTVATYGINELQLYKTALTDAKCITLTKI